MPSQQYKDMEGINFSSLKYMLNGPDHYKYWQENKRPQSDAMRLGELIHLAILEPEVFAEQTYMGQKFNRTTKQGKDLYAQQLEQAGNRTIILPEDKEAIDRALLALSRCDLWQELQKSGSPKVEVAMQWEDPLTGLGLKGCADYIMESPALGGVAIIDVKTAREPITRWDIARYHYDMQAAYYLAGYRALTGVDAEFLWLLVETGEPYGCQFIAASEDTILRGKDKMNEALKKLKETMTSQDWFSRYNEITII
jgi:hypothetical protein